MSAAKEYVDQEGREHAPWKKAFFHSKPPLSHSVVKPHACSHNIVELTNARHDILQYTKKVEYSTEEGLVNRVIRFAKVDKACLQQNFFLSRQRL